MQLCAAKSCDDARPEGFPSENWHCDKGKLINALYGKARYSTFPYNHNIV